MNRRAPLLVLSVALLLGAAASHGGLPWPAAAAVSRVSGTCQRAAIIASEAAPQSSPSRWRTTGVGAATIHPGSASRATSR